MELIVRALVIKNGKILVCQTKGRDYYFLPGGHIEFGESMRNALAREMDEELGAKLKNSEFIGIVENVFEQDQLMSHEINFIFYSELEDAEVTSKEDHLTFYWFTTDEFIEKNIVPLALKDAIVKWMVEKEAFFIQEGIEK